MNISIGKALKIEQLAQELESHDLLNKPVIVTFVKKNTMPRDPCCGPQDNYTALVLDIKESL